MYVKVPEVNRCCFCFPLRYGILIFGIINIVFSALAVSCLVLTTELRKVVNPESSPEDVTSTVLFSILGMGVILNVVLLVGGCQKDISMLRLYNYYASLTALAALVPMIMLLSRRQYEEVGASLIAIVMQIYIIILVRSEIVKLEKQLLAEESPIDTTEERIDVPDTVTLV